MDNCRCLFEWQKIKQAQTVHHFVIFLVLTQVLLSLQNNSIQFHSVTLKPLDSSCVSSVTLPGHRSDIRCVWSFLQSWTCLGKTFHLWRFFQITHAQAVTLPPSHKQGWMHISRIFPTFNSVQGGVQDIFQNVALFYRGTQKLQKIMNTASLLGRTFVHDCNS